MRIPCVRLNVYIIDGDHSHRWSTTLVQMVASICANGRHQQTKTLCVNTERKDKIDQSVPSVDKRIINGWFTNSKLATLRCHATPKINFYHLKKGYSAHVIHPKMPISSGFWRKT